MEIELTTKSAQTVGGGSETLELVAHQRLRIQTNGPDGEVLDVRVPNGKRWVVGVNVRVDEYDAQ